MSSRRIVSGGRHGEVRVWSLDEAVGDGNVSGRSENEDAEAEDIQSRGFYLHDRSTAVGQVRLLRAQERQCVFSGLLLHNTKSEVYF